MSKRLPTEFAINMNLEKMLILQQSELQYVNEYNYFDEENPCHIYFICKRPRLTIDSEKIEISKDHVKLTFIIQEKDTFREVEYKFNNDFGTENIELISQYPYNIFKLVNDGNTLIEAKVGAFIQTIPRHYHSNTDFLDLEILYIGQSYGIEGARTAPDRLKNHSTLQGIYAEALTNNPDCEIWLALASFEQINITLMNGLSKYSEQELEEDSERMPIVFNKLNWEGINEQQKINFTEAALIKYFQPKYNVIYKDNFPNPAHKTYKECYELDINAVCIEMHTVEMINCCMYSDTIKRASWHMENFLLNSTEERRSMFELFD